MSNSVETTTIHETCNGRSLFRTEKIYHRAVTISTFRLDRYEVTVGRFRRFVEAYANNWMAAVRCADRALRKARRYFTARASL
jgi:formylglycine-generating enzyme required for sulfatase activity